MQYALYALTLLISSSLLFAVQPMVGKMVQPVLGGTPAVWNTCMVFFQAVLLGGYLYAHLTTKWLGTRRQAKMHLAVLALGLLFLPVAFAAPDDPASLENPAFWLLGALLIGVGWPFFVISTSAPLLQKWFSTIDHPDAADPYHLYSASNVGSVAALLAYPFLLEPTLGLANQALLWTGGYVLLMVSVGVCAVILWRSPPRAAESADDNAPPGGRTPLSITRRGRWVLWAFIPSSMMLGVTTFVTTDVAPMPLLWIPPLAIFLLSFIIVFARRSWIPVQTWLVAFPPTLLILGVYYLLDSPGPILFSAGLYFAGLFIFCMVFHGLLAADRPATKDLTEFYLWMSVGGVLGGAFNALLAPLIFDQLLEYPAVLVLAALVFPARAYARRPVQWTTIGIAAALGIAMMVPFFSNFELLGEKPLTFALLVLIPLVICVVAMIRPRALTGVLATALLALLVYSATPQPGTLHVERSFFAVHEVWEDPTLKRHVLMHGTTVHGMEIREGPRAGEPVAYYDPQGPIGDIFAALNRRGERHPIAVVGLGSGGLTPYLRPGQQLDYFEIDPVVRKIAEDPELFGYLHNCPGDCQVIMGDGRLQLANAPDQRYELIIQDAYNSTAVPVHLMTVEAIELYLEKLRDDGMLVFHISNRHVALEAPLTQIAEELGLVSRFRSKSAREYQGPLGTEVGQSDWLVMARSHAALGRLAGDPRWLDLEPLQGRRLWTDDYADVLSVYRF